MDILLTKGAIIENKLGQQWELKGVGIALRELEFSDLRARVYFEFYCMGLDKVHFMALEDFEEKYFNGEIQVVSEGV